MKWDWMYQLVVEVEFGIEFGFGIEIAAMVESVEWAVVIGEMFVNFVAEEFGIVVALVAVAFPEMF